MSSVTDVEKVKRLYAIDELNEEGKTDHEIAGELGLPITTIKRNQKYLEELKRADLTDKEISEKRAELYLKYLEAETEAKKLFDMYKHPVKCIVCKGKGEIVRKGKAEPVVCKNCRGIGFLHKTLDVDRFHRRWTETITQMAKLYGLDNVRQGVMINQQFNSMNAIDKVDWETGEKISQAIIASHEKKTRERYEDS